jgi:hypothetical protein
MTHRQRDRLDDDLSRKWLAKHAPQQASKPKLQRREKWEMRREEQKQERRALATPLLKGVE